MAAEYNWTIAKAAGSVSLSATSATLDNATPTATITVTRAGDGAITATSSDDTIATAGVDGTTLTVTGVGTGAATITVSVAAGTNHTAASATVSVNSDIVPKADLNTMTWAQISAIAQEGTGDTYFDIGDTKEITLNGKIGDYFTADNLKLSVFILDFNHADYNAEDNNITFGCFKSDDGKIRGIADTYHGRNFTNGSKTINFNHWGGALNGMWVSSDYRYDIFGAVSTPSKDYGKAHPSFGWDGYDADGSEFANPKANTLLAALPADLRAVMRIRSHWVAVQPTATTNYTQVSDAISLWSETEVRGELYRGIAKNEHLYHTQFAYFKAGNSRSIYKAASDDGEVSGITTTPGDGENTLAGASYSIVGASQSHTITAAFIV